MAHEQKDYLTDSEIADFKKAAKGAGKDQAEAIKELAKELKRVRDLAKKLQNFVMGGKGTLANPANLHAIQIISRDMLTGKKQI